MGAKSSGAAYAELAGVERRNGIDNSRTITSAAATGVASLRLMWSDTTAVELNLAAVLGNPTFGALSDPTEFMAVEVGDWGQSLVWPSGIEIGADSLWLDTLSATGRSDTRTFLEWRLRNGLSLSKAADALGISRRMVAYYSNGEKKLPKPILLACRGWEAGLDRAA